MSQENYFVNNTKIFMELAPVELFNDIIGGH